MSDISASNAKSLSRAFANGVIYSPGSGAVGRVTNAQSLRLGQQLRDEWLFQFPLLPAAVMAYAHIAVSREWTVIGTPRRAARAVETLNTAAFIDRMGELHVGWQDFAFRRVLDYLTLGRNAFLWPSTPNPVLQYADPVEIVPVNTISYNEDRVVRSLTSAQRVESWDYLQKRWSRKEIYMNYAAPVGATGANAIPLLSVLPTARLAYLIREHDAAKADGRKIRDIFIVADDSIRDALIDALITNIALYNGGSVAQHGLPIVSAGMAGMTEAGNLDVSKLFARLGVAEVPESLDRAEFELDYAQEIAAVLDFPLRVFWNDPRGSNRSLERVTQERSRRQGPAFYILSDERLINNSGILGSRVRFQYDEEVDTALIKDRAQIAQIYASAIEKLQKAIPKLSSEAIMAWLQQLSILPRDEDLLQQIQTINESPVQAEDMVDGDVEQLLAEQAQEAQQREREQAIETAETMAETNAILAEESSDNEEEPEQAESRALVDLTRSRPKEKHPDYGEVRLNAKGEIVDYRMRTFTIDALMKRVVSNQLRDAITEQDFVASADKILATVFNES